MANLILAHAGGTAGAAATASSEAGATFAAANVLTRQPSERLRFAGCASEWLQVVLAEAVEADLIALIGNFSLFAEIDILAAGHAEQLPGSPAWSALDLADPAAPADASLWPSLDLDFLSGRYTYGLPPRARVIRVHLPAQALPYRAWRFGLRDPCNPAGQLEINRVVIARKWQPARNFAYGRDLAQIDDSVTEFSMGGAARSTELGRRRSATFTIPAGEEADVLERAMGLEESVGTVGEVLLLQDPAAAATFQRLSIYGRLGQLAPAQNVAHGIWSKRFVVEELV